MPALNFKMILKINSQSFETVELISVQQLLVQMNMVDLNGTAVAVNNEIVLKHDWETYQLQPNDSVIILKASQGG